MKLKRFRVTNFRSVDDSGWINVEDITAFVGTNESGKTNLLVPLWKLNPVRGGEINTLADYPRKRYNEIRNQEDKPIFVRAQFELPTGLIEKITGLTGADAEEVKVAEVSRDFDGERYVRFPDATPVRSLSRADVAELLEAGVADIEAMDATKTEEGLKKSMLVAVAETQGIVESVGDEVNRAILQKIRGLLKGVDPEDATKRSIIGPRYGRLLDEVEGMVAAVSKPGPSQVKEARAAILREMPSFVYYANYGNLDSEIYLPHVIQNMQRTDLGSREEAKTRTLKVLFEFVKLSPQEILQLGQDQSANAGQPTSDQIQADANKKKERVVLMDSASTDLTHKFRDWWKQGDYRLRFQADGNHFRILVSDDKRPEWIELEGRSTGLQWFLSFFLVFLVEAAGAHRNAVLLLDEPGMSLHPIAQKDLSAFFENLSETNQLMYTAHSPFMVEADHLDRVKAVYVDEGGTTAVSPDLRAAEGDNPQSRSIYPVHAAVGLSVSDTLLYGCQPVIVEGRSDQTYLSTIKNYLIGKGRIKPGRELVFMPSGGVKGVSSITSIITGTDEELPYAVLDSDHAGHGMANKLKQHLYSGADERVLMVGEFTGVEEAEVEDLFPVPFLARIIARQLPRPRDGEEEFDEVVEAGAPIIPQVEAFAKRHGIELELGWKVEVAKAVKTRLLGNRDPMKGQDGLLDLWQELFETLQS